MEALDRRLDLIYHMVRPGRPVADVGSDHGRLIAALVNSGRIPCGVATDINAAPLQKTQELIARLGLEDRVQTRCCDGLKDVSSDMADDIVIAGMGGELIVHIIEEWPHSCDPEKRFLLQAMTRPEALREHLYTHGYAIEEERCAKEGKYVYSVMAARYTGATVTPDDKMCYLGAIEDFTDPAARAYADRLLRRITVKAEGLERAGQDAVRWRKLMACVEQCL